MGLKDLIGDTSLEESAREVVLAGNGRLAHKGDPGTFGQVLALGTEYDFEHVFVGGWLCEMPSL
ncbi:hypothetical protein J1614_010718 [Plenodomus biglobosus]|nr:hypothetical protein J1614_010718 [Plenodomus biglobosus]